MTTDPSSHEKGKKEGNGKGPSALILSIRKAVENYAEDGSQG